MGHYTGAKARINRRLGAAVFENAGALRAFEKRNVPPGMHSRRKKPTIYGLALTEKQKIKFYYGFRERQLRKYFAEGRRRKGNTGENLLVICECRLDNVVRRAGFTGTRPQARQGIVHGHFQLNGRKVNKPSIMVRPGDVITLRNRPNLQKAYRDIVDNHSSETCDWISFDDKELRAVVTSLPTYADVSLPVDVNQVVAFLSR
ncbi:30S ribosomal protein S4 [Rubinisphaera sp.]|uniref:30S ribosomal protein S4 n=1 Tax=Rubinisphaera sp. TaxID=2024857 RepID=UPI000C0FB047|nr:30S ribosomal protein S4 [Rubinisphaera sp.]MBV09132.1 30S ribosomal protein S4 [Rubinisphaera sp.]HCS54216.1 30S ribosomal protein S4 [Planctomycetaceae bacterium]